MTPSDSSTPPEPAATRSARTPAPHSEPAHEASRIDVGRIRVGESAVPAEGRQHPKGRFYRPELYSTSERLGSSTALKFAVIVVLLGAAGTLIAVAAGAGMIL